MTDNQFRILRRGIYWSFLSIINFIFAIPTGDHPTGADIINSAIGVVAFVMALYYLLIKNDVGQRP